MRKLQILIAESSGFPPQAVSLLRQIATVRLADLDRAGLEAAIGGAEVLWTRLRHRVDARLMSAAPSLQIIATPTTGLAHIDTDEARRRGIEVISLRGESDFLGTIRATAEHTVALMLALLRHLPAAAWHAREGGWNRDLFQGVELFGKTVGIVGYGRLGRIVARYLRAFEVRILATDPNVDPAAVEEGVTLVPPELLLAESDIVTLHVNLCRETQRFFGRRQFESMKPGSWFVNTARGELVDEQALLTSLRSGRLSGAAIDVLCAEDSSGMDSHPLVQYARTNPNVVITPHLGGCTEESMQKTELFLARKVYEQMMTLKVPAACNAG
jgi:D-3-phosphoglycerate dehydrogenase